MLAKQCKPLLNPSNLTAVIKIQRCDRFCPVGDWPWNSKLLRKMVMYSQQLTAITILCYTVYYPSVLHCIPPMLKLKSSTTNLSVMLICEPTCNHVEWFKKISLVKKRNDHSQSVWNFSLLELFTETACSGYELCMLLKLSLPTAQKLDHSEATVAAFAPPWRKLHALWSIAVVDGLHMGSLHTYMLKWLKQHFMPHLTLIQQFSLLLCN